MHGVLIIPCIGAMQSWGTRSRFHDRDTEREPTKSGIIGVICAALGRGRQEDLSDLSSLKMSVRVDNEGKVAYDYQTVMDAKDKVDNIGKRHHIQDAKFLVALEGDYDLLDSIHKALRNPQWQLSLGRHSYLPSVPFYIKNGLFEGRGVEILSDVPLLEKDIKAKYIRFVTDTSADTKNIRQDVPISFAERKFSRRFVEIELKAVSENFMNEEVQLCIYPD